MPIGPFGEILGTTGTLETLSEGAQNYKSKVIAPRNPKLMKGEQPEFKIKPSQYMFQMSLDTEKKLHNMHTMKVPQKVELLDMSETTHQKTSVVNIDEPMFQPFPSEIFFQNFEPFETYEVPLLLRNNDKVPRLVKVSQEESPYFKIISPHNAGHKVGPGLPTTFKIQFTPEEKKDYNHELVCVTEREKFVVPVRAIGARAILDFPDDVHFQTGVVKYASSRTLLVRNIGNRDAKFSLSTKKPFSVSPANGTLAVNDSIQVSVDFQPMTVGDHFSEMVVHYDTGENIYISLYGAASDSNVRLDKNSIRIENTFISMANQRTVTISNRSDVIAHFRWTQFATQEEEDQKKMMFCSTLQDEEREERDRFLEECIQDPSLRDKMSILSHTYHNRRKLVDGDKMLFTDDVIRIEPVEGDIWPNSSAEVNVVFKPEEATTYSRTAFCDVTGRESRLPLRIRGDGTGPKVQFSFDSIDIGNVFVNSTHTYEVVLANKGDIDAIFGLMPSNSVFKPTFNPMEGIVMPDGHQAIQITFSSAVLGDFQEDFFFQIDGSPEKLKLSFKGSVIGPTFHFDVPKLKFGMVSYGFVNSQVCTLVNSSLVPMAYHLRVPGDGVGESICSTSEYDSTVSEAGSSTNPKEFEITPSSGTLPPKSEVKVQVDLCSNTVKKYDLALVVDVEGVGDEVLSLPIMAKCIVPHITALTPILDYNRCFLRHPYEHHAKLQNDTDLPAKYELVAQQVDEYTAVIYTSPQPKGIIEPHTVMDVPLVITPQGLEELEVTAHFVIFGCPEAPLPVHVTCIGEGPVIHVMPLSLDWHQIPVLTDTPKIVRLSNESLIPAKFTAHMVRPNSVWRVEPNCGEIPAEKQIELTVTACLDDCVRFQDKLQVNFLDAPTRMIPVTGYGHNTTIVSDPPMTPVLNLGPHFSKGPCKRTFTLTNRGRRHQSLVWSTEGYAFIQKPKRGGTLQPINPKDMKYKDRPPPPALPCPTFRLTPQRMELNPGESIDVELEGQVDMPQVVRERMLCHAIIGRAGGKELIMKVQINCEFINPLLEFSTEQVFFRVDKMPEDELTTLTEDLVLTNVSSLPLTTELTLKYPFQILMEDEQVSDTEVYLGIGESRVLKIQFDPAFQDDAHIRIAEEQLTIAYKEHPHVDQVSLKGEVYMPNLEFEKSVVDFGCILNDTEVTRYLNITNNSPMDVKYKWSFLIDDEPVAVFHKRPPPVQEDTMVLEDIEAQRSVEGSIPDEEGEEEEEGEDEELAQVEVNVQGAESPRAGEEQEDVILVEGVEEEKKVDPENTVPDNRDVEESEKPPADPEGDAQDEEQPEKGELDAQEAPVGEGEVKMVEIAGESRPVSRVETPQEPPAINPALQAILLQDEQREELGVEEIFDILPLYGTLKPGDTEQITLTFYGHADIGSRAKAVCEVEGGPTYEVVLKGEASLVNYSFDCLDIDYGKIAYDQVAVAEITLINSGKVGFEFTALGMDPGMASHPRPGVPVMIPHTGFIEPLSELALTVKFLPGVPQKFHKNFSIQVAHFEPNAVNLFGEGVFARVSLDLPRAGDQDGHYESLVKEAKENLTTEMKKKHKERPMSAVSTQHREEDNASMLHENPPSELEIQMEVERLVVQEYAADQIELTNRPDVLEVHPPPSQERTTTHDTAATSSSKNSKKRKKHKPRPRLPDYVLDFGHVVLGTVRTHVVRATNTGWFATSFSVDHGFLYQYGFHVELDRVKQLPGAPDHETVNFVVSFDPRGANLGLGVVETVVPINIVNGPQLCILLRANVTMPDMQISTDVLDFTEVKCGECKVITVQLFNHKHVRCEWNSLPTDKEKKKIDKHVPLHLRRAMRQEKNKPRTFEMMPAVGSLMPGQRQNVQVKFMPTEEKFYENRIAIRLAQSSQRIMLLCRGQGQEPHIEFERSLVEFGPILPHSHGDEQEVVIRNPCKFPVEVYNLECDRGYLEEEKILRLMKGYDEFNTILLPPRSTGEKLPQELLDYYQEQVKKLEEAERVRREEEEAAEAARKEQEEKDAQAKAEAEEAEDKVEMPALSTTAPSRDDIVPTPIDGEKTDRSTASKDQGKEEEQKPKEELDGTSSAEKSKESAGVGELEITPVSAAIARHLGIDLTPEGKAARNRRGIAIIVHGAPLAGKTVSAVSLAKRYEAALLTIDSIVLESISNGNTPAGLKAREMCAEAAQRHLEEMRALEGEEAVEVGGKKAAGLSVEALTAHTQGTAVTLGQIANAHSVAHSIVSNRKTSTISDQKSKGDKHHGSTTVTKTAVVASSGEGGSQDRSISRSLTRQSQASRASRASRRVSVSGQKGGAGQVPANPLTDSSVSVLASRGASSPEQVPSSPPPLAAPIARRLSVSASVAGEAGLMSCVLPEEILVEILAERLMLSDCHRGVVFDGLETLFSLNQFTTAHAILKALNNRKYMFFVTFKLDYNVMKEQEKTAQEERECREREQEEEERRRLEDMSEDEYDALEEEVKADVDRKRLEIKKERLKKEMEERLERERREQEEREAEQKRLEEEKGQKKKRKGVADPKDGKKSQAANKVGDTKSQDRLAQLKSQDGKKGHVGESEHAVGKTGSGTERPDSHATERGESAADDVKRKKGSKEGKRPISTEEGGGGGGKGKGGRKGKADLGEEEAVPEEPKIDPAELLLMQRFRTFEHSYKEISDLVDHWERSTGVVRPATPADGGADGQDDGHPHPPSGRKPKKGEKHDKSKELDRKAALEKANKEAKEQQPSENAEGGEDADQVAAPTEEEKREKRLEEGIGLPHLILDVADKEKSTLTDTIFEMGKLPEVEEVLDGLGLGPRGPPIPPPATFGVVPYPVKRHAPPGAEGGHYLFVAASPDDPNVGGEEKSSEHEDEDKSVTPDGRKDDAHSTPTGRGKKGTDKLQAESRRDKRKTSAKGAKVGRRSSTAASPPPGAPTPASETDGSTAEPTVSDGKTPKLTIFRWTVPAEGEVTLKMRFTSEDLGQFDQTMNFEIMGTRRRYQLYCRGVCAFPTVSREPRIVFPNRKKSRKFDEIVHKKYILTSETYEFGPLLVGKSREKYKEGRYPENMEKLTILNTSPLDADATFCFLNDSKAETYLLDPPAMLLKPGESQELSVWAYPKVQGSYEDALVCCIKENPEPIIFKLLCQGVRPELELDKEVIHFEKVLLHRKDTKTLYLRNSTLLPVAWRLNGLENLGDDFSVSQESGVIEAKSEFALHAYFRAMKAVNNLKKAIRLEVSDKDNIMGVVQTKNIQVHAEAYDVALDMSFPKGADGGIDFDVIRVTEEHKQQCSLKNKGKYDIVYEFSFEPTEACPREVCDMFSVIPQRGTLASVDRPAPVQVIFKSQKEVAVKDQPILRCQIVEPNIGEKGETIASIPIKLSVRSVFSKYNIFPVNDINFGSMLVNSKKTKTFTIENRGDRFEFKYTITKLVIKEPQKQDIERRSRLPARGSDKRTKSRDGSSSGRSIAKPRRAESSSDDENKPSNQKSDLERQRRKYNRLDVGGQGQQSRLQLGMFTIYPAFGFILPGGHTTITVECVTELPGKCEEEIAIDVTGRDPNDHVQGIPYKLIAEACQPTINVADIGSIFEEHRVCKNLSLWQHSHEVEGGGVYGEDENRFIFNNVLVGARAKARFKISNSNKVPCDVVFSLKPFVTKHAPKNQDVFEVDPPRAQIPAHSYVYANVSFCPPSMQHFSATFETTIEGIAPNQAKARNLVFEVSGEGNLPRISIQRPTVRNKKGQPLLLFRRNLVGQCQSLPLNIRNDGSLPSKVDIDLVDPDGAFVLKPTGDTQAVMASSDADATRRPHTASAIVDVDETATFDAIFHPSLAQRSQAQLRLSVVNNQYEDTIIQLVGEGYEDEITLDNVHGVLANCAPEDETGNMADDDVPAAKSNHLNFGDCYVGEPRTLTFTMKNHAAEDCVRFQWPDHPQLKFSPQTGHLHGGCSKDMTVVFKADEPKTFEELEILCKVVKVTFDKPMAEVADWDDRLRTVKWVEVGASSQTPQGEADTPVPPPTPSSRPAKKKVVETEPEPAFTEVPETTRNLELLVSVTTDYCKYKCKEESIHFKDTLMFQTRVFEYTLSNKGSVTMDYNWQIVTENFNPVGLRSVTFGAGESERPPTAAGMVVREERPSSGTSSIVSDYSYMPFTIEPESGTVLPGKKATLMVKFSPLDVNEYEGRLICSIPNLEVGQQGPVIGIKGRSLMPYCHFELVDSDYIRSARRNPELRGPRGAPPGTALDSNTRVIEFKNVGVGLRSLMTFCIVNPTSHNYTFQWMNEDEMSPKHMSDFRCLTSEGTIKSGKKTEVTFEFTSSSLDLVESFWKFVIPEQRIAVPFLLVGQTQDPGISLDRSHLNFKSLLIGHEAMEMVTITNNEDQPFQFSFEDSSLHAPGHSVSLTVAPMSGTVPAKSSLPVAIYFTPNSDKEVNFNVVCRVKRKTFPLTLNVKAEGYAMNCIVMWEDVDGSKKELSKQDVNLLNFGEIEVNEKAIRNIYVINSGKFHFDYAWQLEERSGSNMVNIDPAHGGVKFGNRETCQLSFCPPRPVALRGCDLTLRISNGPSYQIRVQGNGTLPGAHFSFLTYNFGPCFVHRAGMPTDTTVLKLTNLDRRDISVDCLYETTAQLRHNFEACVIAPRETVDVEVTFLPREPFKYRETMVFEINGLSKQSVEFLGQGTELKIEVADPKHRMVKLGAMRVGHAIKKQVPIVNNSLKEITFNLAITPSTPALQDGKTLTVFPTNRLTLAPRGGTAKVEVHFSPKARIAGFTEEVMMEYAADSGKQCLYQPLFVVNGSCQGIEVNLDADAIPFGAVAKNSSTTRRLVMLNTGDIGARFNWKWDRQKFEVNFSITPVSGYISPGMEVPFEVAFHPREVSNDIRYDKLLCQIENSKPLKLTLTGACTEVTPAKEMLQFNTHVRQKETRNLMVANRTNLHWNLRPVIDGEYWTGPDSFSVEPQSNKPYELTYRPLIMTVENQKHKGTVFFPLPDGQGLLYNVLGIADAPKPNGKISREVPCKTQYTEMLTVSNWLKKPQRFKVRIEYIRPDRLDSGTTLKSLDYIDVPGNSKRDHKLSFYAHKEGQSTMKVVFTNEQTGEYQFHEVTIKAGRPGVISAIDLSTPVRQSIQHTLELENPLSYQVSFSFSCNIPEVLMPGANLQVPPESKYQFNFEYLPLKVGETQGRLEFNCNDLGQYLYDLNLTATAAGPERALYFRTCLGTHQTQVAKFLNFSKHKTDYACKLENPDFKVDKTMAAAPASSSGTEVVVEVTYEPSRIGESRDTLTVSSTTGGDYTFPLFGTAMPPKPQGPFIVKSGSNTNITFRNVFLHTTAFTFQVDNPLFHVSKPGENIRPHKDHRIVVGFDGNDSSSKAAVMGKLVVACAKSAGGSSNAQWVYYLKGITPDNAK